MEVAAGWREGSIFHVLLLGVDAAQPALATLLAGVRHETEAVAARAVARLRRRATRCRSWRELAGGGAPLPYHVLLAALRSGVGENFEGVVRYVVGELGISFAAGAPLADTVRAGRAAGGVSVLAHPGRAEFGFAIADRRWSSAW